LATPRPSESNSARNRSSSLRENGRESTLAGTRRTSFLKSLKEKQRAARAQEKREVRQGKRGRAAEARAAAAQPSPPPAAGDEPPDAPVN